MAKAFTPLTLLLLLAAASQTLAQSPAAPAPSPAGPINITAILAKQGNYNTWIQLLTITQVGNQIDNQVNNSNQGMTVFCPTDNAFNTLPAGTINNLTSQQQVQLVLYHVLPQFYTLAQLTTVSNPVRTQASGQDGEVFGLYFFGLPQSNQVNVSTLTVSTTVNNALRAQSPLAMFEVDKVLMPKEFTESPAPAPAPAAAGTNTSSPSTTKSTTGSQDSGSGRLGMGLGMVAGLGLFCIGLLS